MLKGARTVVAAPDGRTTINPTGNAGMATAGTGDALTGAIAAFMAQGLSAEDAARLGVYVHGATGEALRLEYGEAGLLAGEIADRLPKVVKEIAAP